MSSWHAVSWILHCQGAFAPRHGQRRRRQRTTPRKHRKGVSNTGTYDIHAISNLSLTGEHSALAPDADFPTRLSRLFCSCLLATLHLLSLVWWQVVVECYMLTSYHRRLRILEAFREHQQPQPQQPATAAPSPSLTLLSLRGVAFTDELAAAVGSAAPRLDSLDILGTNLSTAAGLDAATPCLCRLITTCAPHLTSLAFKCELHAVTPPLVDAIRTCSRLQHLECRLGDWWYDYEYGLDSGGDELQDEDAPLPGLYATIFLYVSVVRLAGVLQALPSLCSLGLEYQYVDATHGTAAAIRSMTQLTRLHFSSPWYSYSAAVSWLPRNLVHLTLETNGDALQDDDVRRLASELSQLTHLSLLNCVRAMHDEPALPPRSLLLPPALRELHIGCSVSLWGLLALQVPPSLTRLSLRVLNLTNQKYPAYTV